MQELEKILEEIRVKSIELKNKHWGDDERHLIGKGVEVMCVQAEKIIRKHLSCENTSKITRYSRDNDGWIPVEERLPEEKKPVLVQWEKYDRFLDITLTYLDVMWLDDAENQVFETINGIPNGKVIAWRHLSEPYRPERSGGK